MSDSFEPRELKEKRKKALIFPCEIRMWWALACNAFADSKSLKSSFLGRRIYWILRTCLVPPTGNKCYMKRAPCIAPWLVPGEGRGGEMILFPPNMRTLCYPFDSCIRGTFQFPLVSITSRGSDVDLSRTHAVIDSICALFRQEPRLVFPSKVFPFHSLLQIAASWNSPISAFTVSLIWLCLVLHLAK